MMLASGVLLVAGVLIARVMLRAPIRVEMRAHPRLAAGALLVAALALAALVWLAMQLVLARHLLVAGVVVVTGFALWRAAPSYGRGAGLPPGSLGIGTSLDAITDPDFYRHATRRWGRVFKMSQLNKNVVCIADLAVAHELISRHASDLGQSEWAFNRLVPGGYLEYMRGDAHRRYREMLSPAFVSTGEVTTRDVAMSLTRTQLALLAQRPEGGDPEPYLLPIALGAVLQHITGLRPTDPHAARTTSRLVELITPMDLHLPVPALHRAAYAALVDEFRALARTPATDSVLGAIIRHDPGALADDTLAGNLVLMVKEGSIMVRGLLRWVLKLRVEHPEWTDRLRTVDRDDEAGRDLGRRFVLEVLRRHESRYYYRTALRDLTVGDYRIPRGWLVRVCVGEAHEREDTFADPLTFNPDRFGSGSLAHPEFAPFGRGDRACVGRDLALAVAEGFLHVSATEYELETLADGPPWRINRHWGLWRPSRDWRVRAVARQHA